MINFQGAGLISIESKPTHSILSTKFALLCVRYFIDHKAKKTSWVDPRYGPKELALLTSDEPVVNLVFDIMVQGFSVVIKQQKEGWKLWEEAFGLALF